VNRPAMKLRLIERGFNAFSADHPRATRRLQKS
jgi:hypothetical protein